MTAIYLLGMLSGWMLAIVIFGLFQAFQRDVTLIGLVIAVVVMIICTAAATSMARMERLLQDLKSGRS